MTDRDVAASVFLLCSECMRVLDAPARQRVLALLLIEFERLDSGSVTRVCELIATELASTIRSG